MYCIVSLGASVCHAVALCVCLCVCLSAEPRLHARRINIDGEGNALYPVVSSLYFVFQCKIKSILHFVTEAVHNLRVPGEIEIRKYYKKYVSYRKFNEWLASSMDANNELDFDYRSK